MIVLTADQLYKSYPDRVLLENASLSINTGDKIGVIGINGAGKSTLLKIIAGIEPPDSGLVTRAGGVRVGYLPQSPVFEEHTSVLEQVLKGVAISQREAREFECRTILTKLGITDFDADVTALSGGQKKRVAMAAALVNDVELLVLDEPTNHIDSEMVEWLESYLARYKGALLMVTHDRYFLDRVTNRIAELDRGGIYTYTGGYSAYLEQRAQRDEFAQAAYRKQQALLRKELAWIQRGARARSTKQQFRVNRFEELSQIEAPEERSKVAISSMSSRLGKKIIEVENLSMARNGRLLFRDFTYNLLRDDRLGIIGPNGCGKSTLFSILMGKLQPDTGSVAIGDTVRIGYFSQEWPEMDPDQKAIDYIRDGGNRIMTPEGELSATQLMERFLFPSALQYTVIGRLSGGERRRLYLMRVLMEAPNVLLLDEPTNDLDIETLTILEDYLESFAGAVVTVSHDRYFLDKVAEHLFAYENGRLVPYLGGYSDYLAQRKAAEKAAAPERPASDKPRTERTKSEKLRFSFKEQREYDQIDDVIADLESRIEETEAALGTCTTDYQKLQELTAQKEQLETELAEKMDRWVYLNDLAERIAAQNKH